MDVLTSSPMMANLGNWLPRQVPNLIGAELFIDYFDPNNAISDCTARLARGSPPDAHYRLTIKDIIPRRPWVCNPTSGPNQCGSQDDPSSDVPVYVFDLVNLDDNCPVDFCQQGNTDEYNGSVSGAAVIFRGDVYDDKTYAVKNVDSPSDPDSQIVNIACLDTTVAKMHLLGHTSAAKAESFSASVPERQMLLRQLTADYCGIGFPFTDEGTPIRIGWKNPTLQPTAQSQYGLLSANSLEALWFSQKAKCVDNPRKYTFGDITQKCPMTTCSSPTAPLPATMATLSASDDKVLGISGNP